MLARVRKIFAQVRGRTQVERRSALDPKLRFREFKYLLRSNNEVLAIIAEIEERLAGPDAVGLDFLRSRYIAASAKVYKMIRHLNNIAGGNYPRLVAAFDRIRGEIDDILATAGGPRGGALVLPLHDVGPHLRHLVGSKAANLAELHRVGFPVPSGFVVTTEAFRRFMEDTGLGGQLRQALMLLDGSTAAEVEAFSRLLRQKVLAAPLPQALEQALIAACAQLAAQEGPDCLLVLRSSAVGEDSQQTSFAGLYRSVLGVTPEHAPAAYRQVVAALYAPEAVIYRRQRGLLDEDAEMAVLVQVMLNPLASGVLYTTDPLGGGKGPVLISAVRGLGQSLVDGSRNPDLYVFERTHPPALVAFTPAEEPVPGEPALSAEHAQELARLGLEIEERFACPQDVEWALTGAGRLMVLQSRPLQVLQTRPGAQPTPGIEPLLEGGYTARPGAGAGPAHVVITEEDLIGFPDGGVLVARNASPTLAAALPRAAAVVTDVGGVAGHMASLAREMGVPTLVGMGRATKVIVPGQLVTVDAGARRVYPGRLDGLVGCEPATTQSCRRPSPRPSWYRAAQLITKLNLTDPRSPDFTPDHCATFHDITRFVHEMSFREMFRLGDEVGRNPGKAARKLEACLPFELWCVDIGGGITTTTNRGQLQIDDVASIPGVAFLRGLTDPAIDWNRPRPVSAKGLFSVFSGSLLTPPHEGQIREIGQRAYAILGTEYLNFNCRVGYHFTALDSYCGPVANDNYVSFHFHGGAATEDRRHLRAELVERLLKGLGFSVEREGDVVSAFLKNYDAGAIAAILEQLGRMVLFTRQLDMLMDNRQMVDWLAGAFTEGNYNLLTQRRRRRQ